MQELKAHDFVSARFPVALAPDEIQLWFFEGVDRAESGRRVAELVGAYLPPGQAFATERGEFGKPRLSAPATLEFNLSHSQRALLVAISRTQALGVDVEDTRRRRPVLDLAGRFFDPREAAALAHLDPELRERAFLALWSCKEAVVKALGRGIAFGLSRLAFELGPDGLPAALNVIDASAGAAAEWHIVQLEPTARFRGALAWRGPERPLRAFTVPRHANSRVAAVVQSG